jgi:hypothetical protein
MRAATLKMCCFRIILNCFCKLFCKDKTIFANMEIVTNVKFRQNIQDSVKFRISSTGKRHSRFNPRLMQPLFQADLTWCAMVAFNSELDTGNHRRIDAKFVDICFTETKNSKFGIV